MVWGMTNPDEWRTIAERPVYEVSAMGRIRRGGRILKPKKHPGGYRMVCLSGPKHLWRTVHSLVMRAFEGPRPPGLVVAHRNSDKTDNRLNNLIYCTQAQNLAMDRAKCPLVRKDNDRPRVCVKRNGQRRGSDHGMVSLLDPEKVAEIHRRYSQIPNAARIDREMGLPNNTASAIVAGRRWRHLHPNAALRI